MQLASALHKSFRGDVCDMSYASNPGWFLERCGERSVLGSAVEVALLRWQAFLCYNVSLSRDSPLGREGRLFPIHTPGTLLHSAQGKQEPDPFL